MLVYQRVSAADRVRSTSFFKINEPKPQKAERKWFFCGFAKMGSDKLEVKQC
jgi:hypothetical protein